MANEVQITNSPLEVTAPAGLRIPVIVENRINEAVPVTVTNNPEIHGTVRLEAGSIPHFTPSFLTVGRQYNIASIAFAGGPPFANPLRLIAIEYPWLHFESTQPAIARPQIWINAGLIGTIDPA